jgi:hypothetical protein
LPCTIRPRRYPTRILTACPCVSSANLQLLSGHISEMV